MNGVKNLDFIESQLTLARERLDRFAGGTADAGTQPLEEALAAYRTAVELLPTLSISGTRRVRLITELATLRDRLASHGKEP